MGYVTLLCALRGCVSLVSCCSTMCVRGCVEMGEAEVEAFLTHLAVEGKVAAATQNQALSALLFLYREVLEINLPWLDQVVRAKRPARLPVVLTRQEVTAVLNRMSGVYGLLAHPAEQKAVAELKAS